ncbi:hypothetical protein BST95_00465 [Halioglobus japonicus]|uniref:ABC transporter ATP-binding protein n=1 Tax=Halioglobus japonicus TaxID=930805 RepID=A0AAP8MBM3_9GAMM|nr:ABC transporter ATP-binding protein [Halioglobus japonicus]AQA16919.1 hypothetical protein BST95_00465 [Halioglobus japonicus]PLW84803.1 ABC transporter ATP-binding protein [Halioglobus japonicus]GHD21503.1 ABC transporter ATP-binding protein [Halioglobus japonicus]
MTKYTAVTQFRTVLAYLTPHRDRLILILALLLCVSAASIVPPMLAGVFTRGLLQPEEAAVGPWAIVGLWLLVAAVKAGLSAASSYIIGQTGMELTHELRQRLYEHMQVLPLSYHHSQRRGDVLTILYADTSRISHFVTGSGLQALPALVTLLAAMGMMLWLNPLLGGIAMLFLPGYMLAMKILGRRMRPLSRRLVDADSASYSVMEENLGMLPAIKAFNREPLENRRFGESLQHLLAVSRERLWIDSLYGPTMNLIGSAGLVGALALGYQQIQAGQLEAPELVSLMFYAMLMMGPLQSLANLYGQLQATRGAAERIVDFLNEQREPEDSGATNLQATGASIDFCEVSFAYPGSSQVLEALNLHIDAGETVAITGPNGAGKSTLVHLLMRFADPDAGVIRIGGVDTREATIKSVRNAIGLVAQRVLLINGPVRENIAYGKPGACNAEIEAAAISARADDFIRALPDGYDTVIGDQGVRLSGGQRQRLALARTLLKNPAILILDEATSMYDEEGETAFIHECGQSLTGKTVLLITHRESTLALADRVIRLK